MLKHPLSSLDLALSDFFLSLKLKSSFKGTHFQSTEDIHKKMAEMLRAFSWDFRRYVKAWKAHIG
jgi:hypothetical protein